MPNSRTNNIYSHHNVPTNVFDVIIEILLTGLLVFMPFAFGATEAWSQRVVFVVAAVMAGCLGLKTIFQKSAPLLSDVRTGNANRNYHLPYKPQTGFIWSVSYIPLALFLALILLQLAPLPGGLMKQASANTYNLKHSLLADLPQSNTYTLSFYPWAGWCNFRMVLALTVIFIVVINVYRRQCQIRRLLLAISCIGCAVALLALAQIIWSNGKMYWMKPVTNTVLRSGPFVNPGHFGQFMNLTIAAALGLFMVKIIEPFHHRKTTFAEFIVQVFRWRMRSVWAMALIMVICTAMIFISLSRGAMISLLLASVFTLLVMSSIRRLKWHSWLMAVIALGSFMCVLYIGFDAVYNRFASESVIEAVAGRLEISKNLLPLINQFPLAGVGLGAHAVIYPMLENKAIVANANFAENEYVQMLAETGIIGFMLVITLLLIVIVRYWRCIRNMHGPIRPATLGLGYGLLAVMIHSFSDFGQRLPANAVLTAILAALIINIAKSNKSRIEIKTPKSNFHSKLIVALVCCLFLPGFIFLILQANADAEAEKYFSSACQTEKEITSSSLNPNDRWLGTETQYNKLISNAEMAVDRQSMNYEYQYWLNVYRWIELSRNSQSIENVNNKISQIIDGFNRVRLLCPSFGPTYCMLGQLQRIQNPVNPQAGVLNINTAARLAPSSPAVMLASGKLAIEQNNINGSLQPFMRYLKLGGSISNITNIYIDQLQRPNLAVLAAADNPYLLMRVADALGRRKQYRLHAEATRNKAVNILREICSTTEASAIDLAYLAYGYYMNNNYDSAVTYFRKALDRDYARTQWRLDLARALVKTGKIKDALAETQICLRLKPKLTEAAALKTKLKLQAAGGI